MSTYYHIKIRRDTAARWAQENPTPSDGEICYETNTRKAKIGDGINAYNSLPYFGPDNATQLVAGLMSAADKTKLDGIDLSTYAPLASPTFTGTPQAPTVAGYDVSKKLATDAFVINQIAVAATGLMVRCIFNVPANGTYNVIADPSECIFMAVNGEGVAIAKQQKLVAGDNVVDFLFDAQTIAGSKIPDGAFEAIPNMTYAILPERLLEVGNTAFKDCADLKTVYALGATPATPGTDAFAGTMFASTGTCYTHRAFSIYYSTAWASVGCSFANF